MSDMVNLVRRAARELGDPSVVDRALAVLPARDRADARRVFEADQEVPQPERFVQAVREQSASKRFRGKPDALAAHLFAVAVALHVDDEILARWDPTHQGMLFGHAVSVARVHARRGELTRAWSVIEGHVPRWWPVDHAQVAPVELLIDPLLAPLVTPERAEWVLRTPRGGE